MKMFTIIITFSNSSIRNRYYSIVIVSTLRKLSFLGKLKIFFNLWCTIVSSL